jgi:chemotaxis protein methyltransferase CheR
MSGSFGYELTEEEYDSIIRVIQTRFGMDFSCYERSSFSRRLSRAIRVLKLDGVHGLWTQLLKDRDFIYKLIDELTVGMTSLFRDDQFWDYLKKLISDRYGNKSSLKIWHAGCSTGEEVYSLGILLDQIGLRRNVSAIASDLNQRSVNHAQLGEYHPMLKLDFESQFKKTSLSGNLDDYLIPMEGGIVKFVPTIVNHVKFEQGNLLEFRDKGKFDMIFCRNVLIYFDQDSKKKLLSYFYRSLNPGGLLILGYFDSVVPILDTENFEEVGNNVRVFQRIEKNKPCLTMS